MDDPTFSVIGAAIEVHRGLGPGLLESAYEACLCHELSLRGLSFKRQLQLPIRYKGICLDTRYRVDLLVASSVVVEIKTVTTIEPIHIAQILTYMKLGGWPLELIINFQTQYLKFGIRRLILSELI